MNRRSRLAIPVLVVLFTALALWWSVWFPFAPPRVRAAMPANAVLVGEHYRLAADAKSLLRNPALRESFEVLGADPSAFDAFMSGGLGRWLTHCLGGRYALVAYVPSSRHGGPPAWMAASWGGVRAQVLRWLMVGGWVPGWTRLPGRSPIPCYALDGAGEGPVLSAAISEGVVLFCYSHNPAGVRDMTRRLAYGEKESDLPATDDSRGDRVQVRWLMTPEESGPRGELSWDVASSNRIAVHARWPSGMPLPVLRSWKHRSGFTGLVPGGHLPSLAAMSQSRPSTDDWRRLQAGLGQVAGGLVLAPTALLESMLAAADDPRLLDLYRQTLHPWMTEGGMTAVGLLRESYSGRLLGIKTPSLVCAVNVRPGLDLNTALPPLLDRWNAAFGLALLARPRTEKGSPPFLVIDDARRGIYSSMKMSEKPVLWHRGGWLFIASNLNAAKAVCDRLDQPPTDLPQGEWWQAAWAHPADIHHWVDFAAAGTAVRKLTALHAIVRIAQGESSGPAVALMEHTGRVVSALEPFGEGSVRLAVTPDSWTMDVRVGR